MTAAPLTLCSATEPAPPRPPSRRRPPLPAAAPATADTPRPLPQWCPPGVPCEGGLCRCPAQATKDDGSLAFGPNGNKIMEIACDGACVNPLTSDAHCGGCCSCTPCAGCTLPAHSSKALLLHAACTSVSP